MNHRNELIAEALRDMVFDEGTMGSLIDAMGKMDGQAALSTLNRAVLQYATDRIDGRKETTMRATGPDATDPDRRLRSRFIDAVRDK